tara:strand:+ start:646 stop:1581 length:936 start_codon:yes stop_codon:yes gene_type:complete
VKILISSISSFIGSRLGIYLKQKGHDVVLGARSLETYIPKYLIENEMRIIDWGSHKSLTNACQDIDIVIHTAGINAQNCQNNPEIAFSFNSLSTYEFGNACIENSVKLFIFFSTIHVYKKERHEIDEFSPIEDNNVYSKSKIFAEEQLLNLSHLKKTKFRILRLSNVFGFNENKKSNCWDLFINNLTKNAFLENQLVINSNPLINRDFLPMNVLNLLIEDQILKNSDYGYFQICNSVSQKTYTLIQIANLIQKRIFKNKNKNFEVICNSKKNELPETKYKSIYNQPKFNLEIEFIKEIDNLIDFCEKEFTR